ncbi:predicted protein, partial [Nematostella vectensis]
KLGYNALSRMLSVEPDNIVIDLTSERVTSATEELLEAKEMRDDLFLLVLKVLSRACKSAARSSLLILLNLVQKSRFLTVHLSAYLNSHWGKSHMEWEGVLEALQNTVVLFSEMLIRLPSCYVYLPIPSLQKCTSILVASGKIQNNGIEAAVEELVMLMREKSEELRRNADLHRGNRRGAPPEDFRQISVIPTQDDICRKDTPFLRKNKATGGFSSPEHYLDVQFRLMREDFIRPLRQGIQDLLLQWDAKKKNLQDIRVYHNARLLFPVFSEKGISYKVSFDVSSLKRVNWKNSKRLIYGSLLCLSKDNFESFILATVENRDDIELEEGLIDISFHNHAAHGINLTDDLYEMVETTAYFESYRHVLEGLKEIDPQSMPFQRYIVRCESEVDAPAYLRNRMMEKITYDFAPILDKSVTPLAAKACYESATLENIRIVILDTNSWPNAHALNLDKSQLRAVQTALTKEFAVIQGPPGTGKTYIGLKVRALFHHIQNHQAEVRHRPILVVCFTNHALDQFLEGIQEFHPENIVRVGGRCKSEVLSKCNLKEIRRDLGKGEISHLIRRRYWEVKEKQDMVRKIVDSATENVRRCTEELIHEDELVKHGQISTRQKESIRKDHMSSSVSAMPYWLEVMPLLAQERNSYHQDVGWCYSFADIDEANDEAEDFSYEADAMMEARKIDDDDDDDDYDYEARRKRLKNQRLIEIKVADTSEWKTVRGKNSRKRHDGAVRKRMNSNDVMTQKEAEAMEEADLWAIPLDERWRLYRYWISNLRRQYKETVIMHQDEYVEVSQRLNEARRIEDISILRKAAVIGMTTTGAAKYREVLQEIKPRIIIVEEAAEVLEAHIVTALSPGCQHLILIGDHEQLRPNPTVYKLAKDYHLDISLFERVVNNKMHLECLRKQHRMRPEISQMLQHIYPDLENHESVLNFDNIKGVSTNIFFIDHQEREEFIEEGRSRSNIHEAKFVAALCRYLILQGYERSKITVLTMYTGQLLQLKKEMPKDFFNGVRVSAVDNFQGEENDIILLSLVRSNDDGNIGFLRISNRVCVALSRARKGFYCIGNMGLMEEKEELWKKILDDLRQKKKVGQNLVLACQNHPKTLIHASKDSDFKAAPEGGCMVPCATRLECGHVCEKVCHPGDPDHVEYECRKPCPKKLCDLGHDCPRRCFQKCEPCKVLVAKVIPKCQHEQQIPCHVEPEKFKCQEPCPKTLKCGHQCAAKCGDDCTKECMVMIERTLPCGHKHTLKCHVDPTTVKCRTPCNAKLKCLHTCAGNCNSCLQQRVHEQCKSKCDRTLFCGHSCQEPCTKNCPPCQKQCENKCEHSKCKNRCGEPCVPCAEPCAWECRHYKCNKLCGEMCDRPRCDKPCPYKKKCKHPCIGLCGEKCPKKCRICDKDEVTAILFGNEDEQGARFIQLEDCPHIVEVKAMDEWMDKVEDTTFVQLKKCPICTVPIRNTRRYGNIVKRVLRDFETIKGKVALSLREIQPEVRRLGEELRNVCRLSGDHPSFLDTDWNKKLENNLKTSKLTVNQLNVFENQINFLRRLLELACSTSKAFRADSLNRLQSGKTLKKVESALKEQVRPLERHIIADRSWISEQELEDIDEEIRRLELWLSRKILKHQLEKRRKSLLTEDKACIYLIYKALKSGERIDRKDFMDRLDELRKQYLPDVFYESVTNDEKREIVKAVGLAKGHWYKCPNGHFYCIGECGGATQESNCPECGSRIGGTGHRLLEDNSLAPEMDGAQYSAYGDMANMNNFDLDRIDMD